MNLFKSSMMMALTLWAVTAFAQADRNVSVYNLDNGVGLKGVRPSATYGFDPVSVLPEGGGRSLEGRRRQFVDFEGVRYFFATTKNRNIFMQDPTRFEPTYGGWCAYAMSFGRQVQVQARQYTIQGNRIHYFASAQAKQNFDRDVAGHEARSDGFWKNISGEEPRY